MIRLSIKYATRRTQNPAGESAEEFPMALLDWPSFRESSKGIPQAKQ